ncbi:hypothetical protein, variant [Exophiala mesophila]|uniref:Major facilitator superfamily (MFS) profile domain-containing protein n=1 Tax=Exophiala mesophila TaxID=212818 RepID=A0A0D1WYQ4_EXOME|nr:hypothetical protein, variant [Exophiala mesophila]KIV94590.1 hypothetical protein, variant [Exophiala mesophila]
MHAFIVCSTGSLLRLIHPRSVLSQLTTPSTRADVLAWYVTTSSLGSSIGSEASGRFIQALKNRDGWSDVEIYHSLFWVYAIMGVINALLVLSLSSACELQSSDSAESYTQVPQDENDNDIDNDNDRDTQRHHTSAARLDEANLSTLSDATTSQPGWWHRIQSWFSTRLTQISRPTRHIMYKLWFMLVIDSLADGMVPYSLTNYYMDTKFHPAKSTLGDITSVAYFFGAFGAVFAGPLARKIGLINTMVFTHVPSSAAVLLFPLPSRLWLTAALLMVRAGLNNMDQAPRSAFIAAVVLPAERTAVMGITSMLRTLASMAGPTLTGVLAANDHFWIAFVAAGICRLVYDFGLYALFVNVKVDQGQGPDAEKDHPGSRPRDEEDGDMSLEMDSLVDSEDGRGSPSASPHTDLVVDDDGKTRPNQPLS